jgi:Family of unknown function (DUF6445)
MKQSSVKLPYSVTRIGQEGAPIVVIDDCTSDPQHWRNLGLSLDWRPRGDYYPGPRAEAPANYLHALAEPMRIALGQVYQWRSRVEILRCYFSLATTPAHALSLAQRIPHVDSYDPEQIAFVHFLCSDNLGGTAFYRQRSTGFEQIDGLRAKPFEAALEQDFAVLGEPDAAYIAADSPLFERIHLCEPRFNRIVFFPGYQLHCADLAGVQLDPDPAKGRLTIAGFLRPDR